MGAQGNIAREIYESDEDAVNGHISHEFCVCTTGHNVQCNLTYFPTYKVDDRR